MGRLTTYLTILIVMDLLFIITGQLCANGQCSFTSVIFSMAINPSLSIVSDWFKTLIASTADIFQGDASPGAIGTLLGFVATAGVAAGSLIFGLKNDSILFASTGFALALLVGDFINIYTYFYSFSPVFALLMFSPITILYVFTCLEWVRGMT